MSYIKVNLGSKERGLKFNQLAFETFLRNINAEALNTSSTYAMFFAGLEGNRTVKREEPDYTFEQVCEWVDELFEQEGGKEKILEVDKVFQETTAFKNFIKEHEGSVRSTEESGPDKKKVSKKKT